MQNFAEVGRLAGISTSTLKRYVALLRAMYLHLEIPVILFPNVRDHRWLPVARSMPGEEQAQAWSVTRGAIRWVALFAFIFDSSVFSAHGLDVGLHGSQEK
ncbi:MAG: hypothetical protein ACKOHM_03610 [Spartobacteria bacterium]